MDDVEKYLEMQRAYYHIPGNNDEYMNQLVGNYQIHEQFPYDTMLLEHYQGGPEALALDFGCGPGRMIRRMSKYFKRVDGVDISPGMIDGATRRCADLPNPPMLWVIDGKSLPEIPDETYDFVYCTISYHHIASYPIRMSLLSEFSRVLKKGGHISLQMMYTDQPRQEWAHHVDWRESNHDAKATNGFHDVRITPTNLPEVTEDFASVGLKDFKYSFRNPPFYHETTTAFIFIHATKE